MAAFIYLYGTWVYLSIYAKYVFGIVYVLQAGLALWRMKKEPPRLPTNIFVVFARLFLTAIFVVLIVLYFTGTTGKPDTVELRFPFKPGNYFVLQGGKGLPTNLFHFSLRGAIYAMDIVKLDNDGRRANKIFSKKLDDYIIFNDTIYSPCEGVITRAVSENPDNIPPNMNRGPKNTNMVVIETTTYNVFMGHIRQDCVFVKEGDHVKEGDPIGCVGNSGFSTEPHLHIQVHQKEGGQPWYRGKPLYIHFDGKGYLLNEVIHRKNRP
ncbi:M23 family metallopeptidase [Chitinophaga skermanii]|nr:M23 family metallopeptidase [Chitinophaga skermanii]